MPAKCGQDRTRPHGKLCGARWEKALEALSEHRHRSRPDGAFTSALDQRLLKTQTQPNIQAKALKSVALLRRILRSMLLLVTDGPVSSGVIVT